MKNNIIVFDFETCNLSTDNPMPVEVAGIVYDGEPLNPVGEDKGGEFCSQMKPMNFDKRLNEVSDKALEVNGKTITGIREFPDEAQVWASFAEFVKRHKTGNNEWGNPIPAGHNIVGFDIPISRSLNARYGIKSMWHARDFLDTHNLSLMIMDGINAGPPNYKMDTLRDFFGIKAAKPHTALQDCRDCGKILIRYLKLMREYGKRINFKGACSND